MTPKTYRQLWDEISASPDSRSGGMNFYTTEDGSTVQETWEAKCTEPKDG